MERTTFTDADRPVRTIASRSALAALLSLGLSAPGLAVDKSWNAGDGDWDDAANWTPFGEPLSDDAIRIGDLPGVQNGTVMLTPPGSGYDFLEISSGMTLDMNNNELVSFGEAWVLGAGSRLIARPAVAGPNQHDFQGALHVGTGAHFEMYDNVDVRVFHGSASSGTIFGRGTFYIASVTPFRNDGVIRPSNNGGLTVRQGTVGDQVIDLDGLTGNGQIDQDTPFAVLAIEAGSLADTFSGTITMVKGCGLNMDIIDGWTADAGSVIDILGSNDPNSATLIYGSDWVLDGTLNVNSFQAHLRVLSDVTIEDNAEVIVGFTDWLELDGATTVSGGSFLLGNAGVLDFDGQTTVQAGTFATNSSDPANGSVDFNGATTWNGGCDIDGAARQFGNAFVAGPSVVNAATFDMDGDGDTLWTVWNDLVINADSVQSDNPEDFHGTMTIASGAGRLTMNLPGAEPLFSMAGEMNFVGHPAVFFTRYDGSAALDLIGNLNVSGKVAMDGALRASDGVIDIGDANAVLRLDGGGLITTGCTFTGLGELRIGAGGNPLFADADLGAVGLRNQGNLRLQSHVRADRFDGEAGSTWELSLEGTDPGVTYDVLSVAGTATLGGELTVTLENNFTPAPAAVFTVVTAATLAGVFDNVADGGRVFTTGGEGSFVVDYDAAGGAVVLSGYTCAGDLNLDGQVNIADLLILLTSWDTPNGDCDGDGNTDFADVLVLLVAWGACP